MSQSPYLSLASDFFFLLLALLAVAGAILALLRTYGLVLGAYESLGVSWHGAVLLLLGSLIGSYFNIPIAAIPDEHIASGHVVELFGTQYVAPNAPWPGTVIAVNVGGAVIRR
jgi:uncharacterized membrane protein